MYEWVQRLRPDVTLSTLHRLDKATSGLLVFGKSTAANQSLAQQFEGRAVTKHYELLVERDRHRLDELRCDQPIRCPGRRRPERGGDRLPAAGGRPDVRALRRATRTPVAPIRCGSMPRRSACPSSATTSTAASTGRGCSCTRPACSWRTRPAARSTSPPTPTSFDRVLDGASRSTARRRPGGPRSPCAAVRPGRHRRLPLDRPAPRRLPDGPPRTSGRRGAGAQLRRVDLSARPDLARRLERHARPAGDLRAAPTQRRRRRSRPGWSAARTGRSSRSPSWVVGT